MIKTSTPAQGVSLIEPQFNRLTAANADSFKTDILALIEAGNNLLVIDLAPVSFVDSSGIGALVGLLKRIGNRGELALCGLSENVMQAFKITHMNQVFTIHTDSDRAVRALAG
jgi:anti-sigma B factor antagonist